MRRRVITNSHVDKVLHVIGNYAVVLRFGTTKYIYKISRNQDVIDVEHDTVVDVIS